MELAHQIDTGGRKVEDALAFDLFQRVAVAKCESRSVIERNPPETGRRSKLLTVCGRVFDP